MASQTSRTKRNCRSIKIVIPGKFSGLNEFISANRKGGVIGNRMKQLDQICIYRYIPKGVQFKYVKLIYHFYEPNARRDKDNISGYFHKVFQDALVQAGVIPNDGWKNISDFEDHFDVDKANPRIEVEIYEQDEDT